MFTKRIRKRRSHESQLSLLFWFPHERLRAREFKLTFTKSILIHCSTGAQFYLSVCPSYDDHMTWDFWIGSDLKNSMQQSLEANMRSNKNYWKNEWKTFFLSYTKIFWIYFWI